MIINNAIAHDDIIADDKTQQLNYNNNPINIWSLVVLFVDSKISLVHSVYLTSEITESRRLFDREIKHLIKIYPPRRFAHTILTRKYVRVIRLETPAAASFYCNNYLARSK